MLNSICKILGNQSLRAYLNAACAVDACRWLHCCNLILGHIVLLKCAIRNERKEI